MADIRISTQVEGLQQALSDIQTLRSQLEGLGSLNVSAAGVGGGMSGGGGGGGLGVSPAGVVAIPPPATGDNGTGAGDADGGPTTGAAPTGAPGAGNTQDQLKAEADAAQARMLRMAGQSGGQMAQMLAGSVGMGGELQLAVSVSQMLKELQMSNVHLGSISSAFSTIGQLFSGGGAQQGGNAPQQGGGSGGGSGFLNTLSNVPQML